MSETVDLGGLACQLDLPVSWIINEGNVATAPAHHFNNQNRLRMVLGLDEASHDVSDESQDLGHELQRLDFKLNVILEMVGQLVSQNLVLPQVYAVTLGPSAMLIKSVEAPPLGQSVLMKLYLEQRFPFPLDILAEVVSVAETADGFSSRFDYLDMDETCQDLLEKYIFRQHRRQVALMRKSSH